MTNNLKDFRSLPEGVEAQSADEFLMNLFGLGPGDMTELVRTQAGALKKPPRSLEELLAGLGKMVPEFSMAIRQRLDEERDL